ncbi:MAG: site-specific DNA-methyltransferase [Acidobacteriota bacterium]|nr:site-specific DNA-methyltransferase [Acidobacteriota bacterium]
MAKKTKKVETLIHREATRRNIPTAEYQPVMHAYDRDPIRVAYERRNPDLDPQLVWRGKDMQDWSELVVPAPPLFIQEKMHPKVLIDDLGRVSSQTREQEPGDQAIQPDLFGDFNGLPDGDARTEFYQHDANWSNRMILGDSLQVMASLTEREGLRGKVQCIYIDPPYGIKFNSNFQWSTTSRDVKDGKKDHITREPEQVKAFRDTWRDGIHSYLTYLRDRLNVARDLLTESGSVFVQIGDENVHRVRAVMDEVFGAENFLSQISFRVTANLVAGTLGRDSDYLLWYARRRNAVKYRQLFRSRTLADDVGKRYSRVQRPDGTRVPVSRTRRRVAELANEGHAVYRHDNITSQGATPSGTVAFEYQGQTFHPGQARHWTTTKEGLDRLGRAERVGIPSRNSLAYVRFLTDFPVAEHTSVWRDTQTGAFTDRKVFVVQTNTKVVERCFLMTTDPGDLVLDPTCGSGTAAYVAEQWGRRWITIDTSRVALALARARIMGARYPYYLLADSREGQLREAALARKTPSEAPTYNDVRQGFVYERVPHITLKLIANNAEIDVIHERMQADVEAALSDLNHALQNHAIPFTVGTGAREGKKIDFRASPGSSVALPSGESAPANGLLEWEVPREPESDWNEAAREAHERFWQARIARQREIDACIAASADYEQLYDKPYQNNKKVRVAGPFTVESVSPHRLAALDEDDELLVAEPRASHDGGADVSRHEFAHVILENLRTAGVQQARKAGRIVFSSLEPWPGDLVCAEGRYTDGVGKERSAGVFIGPEFGTVSRPDLVSATREAADAGFDALIACAFNFEAHATEFTKLGRVPVLKARMNADLHMADDLKKTNTANLFVIFGEPDIDIEPATGTNGEPDWLQVKIKGVDVFDPSAGEVRSDGPEGIACWFVDTDYNEESFFVRQAYFLGAGDPYKSLRTTLKAEIDPDAWATLHSDTSRPFPKPATGRIAVKVINHLGDEVMKVFGV